MQALAPDSLGKDPDRRREAGVGRSGSRPLPLRPALADVLHYDNEDIVERFTEDQGVDPERARLLFEDVKRWLWLCNEATRERALGQDPPRVAIFKEQQDLDEMWHTFVLFTRAYVDFCHRYFGYYLHHEPTPEREKREFAARLKRDPDAARAERADSKHRLAAYVFDKLGEQVARRWYLPKAS